MWHLPYIRGASACQVQGSRPIDACGTNTHIQLPAPFHLLRLSHQYYCSSAGLTCIWMTTGQRQGQPFIPQSSRTLLKCPQIESEAFIAGGTYIVLCLWLPCLGSLSLEVQFPTDLQMAICHPCLQQPHKINYPKNYVHMFVYPESSHFCLPSKLFTSASC